MGTQLLPAVLHLLEDLKHLFLKGRRMTLEYGVGLHGGTTRCYRFYQELMECGRVAGPNDHYFKCQNEREDYIECLHQKKLQDRLSAIQKEKKRLIKAGKWPPKTETVEAGSETAKS